MMGAEITIAYEQRVFMAKRQVRCCVGAACSDWRYLDDEDAAALDAEEAVGDGGCLDVEAMFRVARNCWPGPQTLENA